MPIDLTGIVNENELSGLASDFHRFIKDFNKAPAGKGLDIFYEWSVALFAALGYELRRQPRPVEGIGSVDIWGAWSAVQQNGPDIVLLPLWQSLLGNDDAVLEADPLSLTQPGFQFSGDKIL